MGATHARRLPERDCDSRARSAFATTQFRRSHLAICWWAENGSCHRNSKVGAGWRHLIDRHAGADDSRDAPRHPYPGQFCWEERCPDLAAAPRGYGYSTDLEGGCRSRCTGLLCRPAAPVSAANRSHQRASSFYIPGVYAVCDPRSSRRTFLVLPSLGFLQWCDCREASRLLCASELLLSGGGAGYGAGMHARKRDPYTLACARRSRAATYRPGARCWPSAPESRVVRTCSDGSRTSTNRQDVLFQLDAEVDRLIKRCEKPSSRGLARPHRNSWGDTRGARRAWNPDRRWLSQWYRRTSSEDRGSKAHFQAFLRASDTKSRTERCPSSWSRTRRRSRNRQHSWRSSLPRGMARSSQSTDFRPGAAERAREGDLRRISSRNRLRRRTGRHLLVQWILRGNDYAKQWAGGLMDLPRTKAAAQALRSALRASRHWPCSCVGTDRLPEAAIRDRQQWLTPAVRQRQLCVDQCRNWRGSGKLNHRA